MYFRTMKIVAFPFVDVFVSPIGKMVIKATKTYIHQLYFDDEFSSNISESTLTKKAKQQLAEYFDGKRQQFDLPLTQEGTAFQQQVWGQLLHIPFGQTLSYLELALQFDDENLVRAVAGANARNKLAIVVPCHRIVSTDGKLTGYAWGLKRKSWLLDFEAKTSGKKLSLF
jgi:methylated-DNA-[protein]-cysteine S-methyltransferase